MSARVVGTHRVSPEPDDSVAWHPPYTLWRRYHQHGAVISADEIVIYDDAELNARLGIVVPKWVAEQGMSH